VTAHSWLINPHLEAQAFFWRAGKTGVLLIHGFIATTASMRLLGEYLHAREYTVLAPLLPGHGTTPADLNRQRWRDWTNAVARAYHELAAQCEAVFVCGSSMGGVLALYLASEQPVAGVCVYAPAILGSPSRVLVAHTLALFMPYLKNPPAPPGAVGERWSGYAVTPLRAVAQLSELQRATRARLSRIHQPLMVIQGRRDRVIDPRCGAVILAETNAARKELHWMENSGHTLPLDEEWGRVAELTVAFMQRTRGA
jgi:carboxylesterase